MQVSRTPITHCDKLELMNPTQRPKPQMLISISLSRLPKLCAKWSKRWKPSMKFRASSLTFKKKRRSKSRLILRMNKLLMPQTLSKYSKKPSKKSSLSMEKT